MGWIDDLAYRVLKIGGTEQISRKGLNLVQGTGVTILAADVPSSEESRVTIAIDAQAVAPAVTQAQAEMPNLGLAIGSAAVLAIEMPVTVLPGRQLSLSWSLRIHAAAGSPARYVLYFYAGTESGFDVEDDLLVPTKWVEGEFPGDSSDLYHGVSGTSPVLGLAPGEWIIKCAVAEAGSGTERMDVSGGINPSLQLVQYV